MLCPLLYENMVYQIYVATLYLLSMIRGWNNVILNYLSSLEIYWVLGISTLSGWEFKGSITNTLLPTSSSLSLIPLLYYFIFSCIIPRYSFTIQFTSAILFLNFVTWSNKFSGSGVSCWHFSLINFSGPLTESPNINLKRLNPKDSYITSLAANIKKERLSSHSIYSFIQYVLNIIFKVQWNLSSAPCDCEW